MRRMRVAWMVVLVMVVLPPGAQAAGWRALVVNDEHPNGDSVTILDTATDVPRTTVPVGATPGGVAVTPDAGEAWVANFEALAPDVRHPSLQPIDLTALPPTAGPKVLTPSAAVQPFTVAVSPDGTAAYAPGGDGNVLLKLDLTADPPVLASIALDRATYFIALTPDGRKAYLSATSTVVPVNLVTGIAGTPIAVGADARGLAVTPDGSRVLVAVNGADQVRVIDTATDTVAAGGIAVPGANELAVSPDGGTAWATTFNGSDGSTTAKDGFVYPIDIATATAGTPIDVRINDLGQSWGIAVTPDARKLYVSDGRFSPSGSTVRAIDLTTSPPQPGPPIGVGVSPRWIAVTPDQAPVAALNIAAAPPGSATGFDASGSTSASSAIARYAWDFGDGATTTTDGPTTQHTYERPGSYPVSLTLTTAGGTSTERVYTGQSVLRNGGPGARTGRTLELAAGPQPSVTVAPALLDFGHTPTRSTRTRAVVVTNSGTANLHVTGAGVEGANAGDFAVVDNGCGTVAPGANCPITVRFAPTAPGERRAVLRIASDAAGSPHAATLLGTATDLGAISGVVVDAAGHGLADLNVQSCLVGRWDCRVVRSAGDGGFRFDDLPAGAYGLRAFPRSQDLAPGEAALTLGAGEELTQDLVLRPLPGFSDQLSLLTPRGAFASGRPSIYYRDPLQIVYKLPGVPDEAAPGTRYLVTAALTLTTGGGPYTWEKTVTVTYGDDRHVASVAPVAAAARAAPVTVVARPAQATPGECFNLFQKLVDENRKISDTEWDIISSGGLLGGFTGVLTLRIGNDQIEAAGKEYDRLHKLYDNANCEEVLKKAAPKPPPKPPLPPGPGKVDVKTIVRDVSTGKETIGENHAGMYIDPSGTVTSRGGVPLEAATVVLDRRQGAFAPLPAGSDLMSPGNRRNPDRTDQTGRFGWDVLAGTYRVRASRRGCKAGRTGSLVVPPPRVGLVIRLRCAHISRVPTRLRIRVRRAGGVTSLVARVTPASRKRGLPRGSVLFRAGGRSLGRLPVDPRSGTATATLRGKAPSKVRVAYSGDARFAPSRR